MLARLLWIAVALLVLGALPGAAPAAPPGLSAAPAGHAAAAAAR